MVWTIFLCGAEGWTKKICDKNTIEAFESGSVEKYLKCEVETTGPVNQY